MHLCCHPGLPLLHQINVVTQDPPGLSQIESAQCWLPVDIQAGSHCLEAHLPWGSWPLGLSWKTVRERKSDSV